MDFKKILAGMSALAIASTVAVAAFADGETATGTTSSVTDSNVDAVKGTKSNLYAYKATEKVAEYTVPAAKVVAGAKVVVKVSGDATKVKFDDNEIAVANGEATYTATAAATADLVVKADKGAIESVDVVTEVAGQTEKTETSLFKFADKGGAEIATAATIGGDDTTTGKIKNTEFVAGNKLTISTVGATDKVAIGYTAGTGEFLKYAEATAADKVATYVLEDEVAKKLVTAGKLEVKGIDGGLVKEVEFAEAKSATKVGNATYTNVGPLTTAGTDTVITLATYATGENAIDAAGDKVTVYAEVDKDNNAAQIKTNIAGSEKNLTAGTTNEVTFTAEAGKIPATVTVTKGVKVTKIVVTKKDKAAVDVYAYSPTTGKIVAEDDAVKGNVLVIKTTGVSGTVTAVDNSEARHTIGTATISADPTDAEGKKGIATITLTQDTASFVNAYAVDLVTDGATIDSAEYSTVAGFKTGTKVYTYAPAASVASVEIAADKVANIKVGDIISVTTATNAAELKKKGGAAKIATSKNGEFEIVADTETPADTSNKVKVSDAKAGFTIADTTITEVKLTQVTNKTNTESIYKYTTEAAPTSKSIFGSAVTDVKKGDQIVVTTEKGAKVTVAGKEVTADDNGVATLTVSDENLSGGFEVTSDKGITAIDKVVMPVVEVPSSSESKADSSSSSSSATDNSSSNSTADSNSNADSNSEAETVTTPVYEGSLETGDWANAIEVKKTTIDPATLKVGDKIVVSATVTDAAAVTADKPAKITVQDAKWGDIADFGYPEVTADKAEYVFTITEAALTQLKTSAAEAENAFVVKGTNATITKVAVVTVKEDAPAVEKVTPAKVTGGKEKSASGTAIRLSWNEAENATGYIIYKYDAKAKKYVRVGKTAKTEFVVKKLASGTQYKFAVKSFHRNDDKSISYAAAQTGIVGYTKVYAPSALTAKNSAKGKATVSFTKSKTSGVKYKIMYKTTAKGKYKTLKKITGNKYTFAAKKNKTYYIQVQAYKTIGKKVLYSAPVKKAVKITKLLKLS